MSSHPLQTVEVSLHSGALTSNDQEPTTGKRSPVVFPPKLVPVLRALAKTNGFVIPLADSELEELLLCTFFASLRTEEHEHHPLRIVIIDALERDNNSQRDPPGWQLFRFRPSSICSARQMVRLARAARSERLFVAVASRGQLVISGLGRESGESNSSTLKLVAPEPGSLEVWVGRHRLLEYAHGHVMEPPENVLLAAGSVRNRLHDLASTNDLPEYVESVTALVRHVADHTYGGILILSDEELTTPASSASFLLEPGLSVGALLERLAKVQTLEPPTRTLLEESLRAELERTLSEVGRLSALDGATILDTRLNVLGFGVILPIVDNVTVLESVDAAASSTVGFPLHQYGARHRAAASYATLHPGSLVFVASSDGDMACMLSEAPLAHVLAWRFRSGDLSKDI